MNEIRYLISDASKKVDVETHVLRYWEDELGVSVPRNEMGHRYYTEFHIHLFCQVKKLKDRGYQLKAIKNALQQAMEQNQGFMQAAGLLEEDMARTLWENPYMKGKEEKEALPKGIARLADYNRLEPKKEGQVFAQVQRGNEEKDGKEKGQEDIEIEKRIKREEGMGIEGKDEGQEEIGKEEKIVGQEKIGKKGKIVGQEEIGKEEKIKGQEEIGKERKIVEQEETEKKGKKEEKIKEKVQNKPELKEKDGQTEMKKRGKNRKKPSAWERRNGMIGKEAENKMEESDEFFQDMNLQKASVQKAEAAKSIREEMDEAAGEEESMREADCQEKLGYKFHTQIEQQKFFAKQENEQMLATRQTSEKAHYGQSADEKKLYTEQANEKEFYSEQIKEKELYTEQAKEKELYTKQADERGCDGQPMDDTGLYTDQADNPEINCEIHTQQMKNQSSHTFERTYQENAVSSRKDGKENVTELAEISSEQKADILFISNDEKMQQFQEIMTYIIGHALEANNERLSQEISRLVNERLSKELEDLMRIRDERDEERFRQFDEIIRSYQRDNQGKAEAAAARIPFFRKRRFKKHRSPQNA